jgi:hypothetical protein
MSANVNYAASKSWGIFFVSLQGEKMQLLPFTTLIDAELFTESNASEIDAQKRRRVAQWYPLDEILCQKRVRAAPILLRWTTTLTGRRPCKLVALFGGLPFEGLGNEDLLVGTT